MKILTSGKTDDLVGKSTRIAGKGAAKPFVSRLEPVPSSAALGGQALRSLDDRKKYR